MFQSKSKTIVMVKLSTTLGGIETLILRKSEWYIRHGYKVLLFSSFRGDLHGELTASGVNIFYYYLPEGRNLSNHQVIIDRYVKQALQRIKKIGGQVEFVETYDRNSAFIGERIAFTLKKPCLLGVFNVDAYTKGQEQGVNSNNLLQNFVMRNALYFMNEATKLRNQAGYNFELSSVLYPIMLDVNRQNFYKAKSGSLRLLSLGRFTYFKTYNEYMLDIVNKLKHIYPKMRYTIIGTGDDSFVRNRIQELNLHDEIKIINGWPYEKLQELIPYYDLHIGMGTSLIDLALFGMPSIICLESDTKAVSPGFFNEYPWNTGETYGPSLKKVEDLIIQFASMNEESRTNLSKKSIEAVSNYYDIEKIMPNFVEFALKAKTSESIAVYSEAGKSPTFLDFIYWLFHSRAYKIWVKYINIRKRIKLYFSHTKPVSKF